MDDQQPTHRNAGWLIGGDRRIGTLIAALVLAAATWMLYGSVCSGWWYADDAAHLWFVIQHDQIWQYFAMPEVSRAFSEASLVPWAAMLVILYLLSNATRGELLAIGWALAGAAVLYVVRGALAGRPAARA